MNILLVEDEEISRKKLGKLLRSLGHYVVECCDGIEALNLVIAENFHMVLSDIKMPRMSGIELLRNLPAGEDVDVVLITGYGSMESVIEALRAGAYDYLLKPVNVEELIFITERVAEHQYLQKENKILTDNFRSKVEEATEETRKELYEVKKAYAELLNSGQIGVFSNKMKEILKMALKFHSDRSVPVLISGETGTGKEIVARYIHYGNSKVLTNFVGINCATLNENMFESELFGYEPGSYTGALMKGQRGKFDIAFGGTIYFDEITELTVNLQAKLLRVIQEKEYYRVGGLKKIKTDVRIVCATNVDIEKKVKDGSFRQDLFYRLFVGRIFIPPLRERAESILPLTNMFLEDFNQKRGRRFSQISQRAADILCSYNWPGNVRELKNLIDLVTLMYDEVELKPKHLSSLTSKSYHTIETNNLPSTTINPSKFLLPAGGLNIENYFNQIVLKALKLHNGNKTETARYLGISRSSLHCRLKRLNTMPSVLGTGYLSY